MNYNNNQNLFVNLPNIVLSKILYDLSNIDKFSFTLVCKKWYESRDKIVSLDFIDRENDYIILDDKSDFDLIEIASNVNTLIIGNVNRKLESFQDLFIQNPNITILHIQQEYTYPLKAGSIPLQIKQLTYSKSNETLYYDFEDEYNDEAEDDNGETTIDIGSILHDGLERFEMIADSNTILTGKLPPLLLELNLTGDQITIDSIPTDKLNLLFLSGGVYVKNQLSFKMATSLHTLCIGTMPFSLLRGMLPQSLESVCFEDEEECYLQVGDIPASVLSVNFKLNEYEVPQGIIPSTVKKLYLGFCYFDLHDERYGTMFFTDEYDFEVLDLGNKIDYLRPGYLPRAKKLIFQLQQSCKIEAGSIPHGVENLTISLIESICGGRNVIPNTVKQLTLHGALSGSTLRMIKGDIPDSVETLTFQSFSPKQMINIDIPYQSVKNVIFNYPLKNTKNKDGIENWLKELLNVVNSIKIFSNSDTFYRRLDNNHFIKLHKKDIIYSSIIRSSRINYDNL